MKLPPAVAAAVEGRFARTTTGQAVKVAPITAAAKGTAVSRRGWIVPIALLGGAVVLFLVLRRRRKRR